MTRLMVLRVTAFAAKRFATIRPSRAREAPCGASRGVVTTSKAPLAIRLPFRARAYSEGRCRRAVAGSEARIGVCANCIQRGRCRSEEHTSDLQSLMRRSYAD